MSNNAFIFRIKDDPTGSFGFSMKGSQPQPQPPPTPPTPEDYPDLTEFYSVSHRGEAQYTTISENTVEAFAMSKKLGYEWVETDIRHTSDHVPILNHSETVDVNEITSPITISDTTWATLSSYTLAGTTNKMSSLEEGLTFCKNNGLRMYLELKDGTQEEIESVYATVDQLGMKKKVVWISADSTLLEHIKSIDPIARLIYVVSDSSSTNIDTAASLITATNQVGLDVNYDHLPQSSFDLATAAGLTVGVWTINDPWEVLRYYRMGVKHFTSDKLRAEQIINSLITLTSDDFVTGKIQGGYINSLNTSDTTRISYVGDKLRVKSGTKYSIIARPVSGLTKTLQVGAQIFGEKIYKKIARGEIVTTNDGTDKFDSGWQPMNYHFEINVGPYMYTSGFNKPTIMALTLHHTDSSDIIPSELRSIEIIEIGETITNM